LLPNIHFECCFGGNGSWDSTTFFTIIYAKNILYSAQVHFCKSVIIFTFAALSLRLIPGPNDSNGTGRIEVLHKGQWGTICDDSWSLNDAEVACRQLGYHYGIRALPGYQVADGYGQIWLSNVGCYGDEQSLSSCYHSGWGVHYCGHNEDAGVECSTTGIIIYFK
jgi:hypothetical protein